ncbi:MAG: hypothetical protein AB7O80_04395 [Acetobacteraceae bacterium]
MQSDESSRRTVTHRLTGAGERAAPRRRRSLMFRLVRAMVILGLVGGIVAGAGVLWFLNDAGRTPREWAPYLERRAEKHRAIIVDTTAFVANQLMRADRPVRPQDIAVPSFIGASADRSGPVPPGRFRLVAGQADLQAAAANAEPGDVIQLVAGRYPFSGRPVGINRPGTADAPIVVRAERLGDVIIETDQIEAIKIAAPYWRFENLVFRGTCGDPRYCEHAFHIVGAARGTVIRNNRIEDMNAQLKINTERGEYPDDGVIEGNTLVDTKPRATRNPITPIDLVAASNWRISGNLIADFVREPGWGGATYGAFVKGAGEGNVMERNVILCEWKLRDIPGQRVGLSLGGGGTAPTMRREMGRTGFEQIGGVIRDNLIAFCSDDGIYINRSVRSVIEHNTLLDTAGIDVRFPESSAEVIANIVDGKIASRDGGLMRAFGNESGPLLGLFVGYHPARDLFRDPAALDLHWRERPPTGQSVNGRIDLCGAPRPARPVVGAFEDWSRCR